MIRFKGMAHLAKSAAFSALISTSVIGLLILGVYLCQQGY